MSGAFSVPVSPSATQSSNLLQYRALFQVFTYARVKKQSAEPLARDAMTGGVVVPFVLPFRTATSETPYAAVATPSAQQTKLTASQSQPQTITGEGEYGHVLLLPSSKCISTLATLLADGFFNMSPLSSTVEKVHGAPHQHRSECEARDLFTLIELLYPDCFVAEALPRALLALRRAESTTPRAWQSSYSATRAVSPSNSPQAAVSLSRGWKSPPAQDARNGDDGFGGEEVAEPAQCLLPSTDPPSSFLVESRSGLPVPLADVHSPTKSSVSELTLDPAHLANSSVAPGAAVLAGMMVPEVDPVPLAVEGMNDLLACRRSLATVLLSSLNEALHDVQYRELERSRPTAKERAVPQSSSEAVALRISSEVLLTAKMLLMSVMAASEVWRRRAVKAYTDAEKSNEATPVSQLPSPYLVLHELFEQDESIAAQFTAIPVEEWTWGRDKESTARWYDQTLDRLLQSTEAAGVHLDAFLQSSKTFSTQQGEAVSHAPTLLLHRPSDGRPAVELNLSFMDTLNCAVPLPAMPLQLGEVQLLLHPRVVRETKAGVTVSSRGHELLFDAAASPTADFLQSCVSSPCPWTMLQESGGELPAHFRHRFHEFSPSERNMIKTFLEDSHLLGAFLEKNAPMLARVTLWCDGQWPTSTAVSRSGNTDLGGDASAVVEAAATSGGGSDLAAEIKDAVMFRRPFNAAVGRYVREMVVLNGFDQDTLERWICHICRNVACDDAFPAHKAVFAALVKFAALQCKWTWTSAVDELQKQYLP
ncbi:hypothetical protein ABB37_05045 [Leptomonas pyrrhocoris]|uniref:Uncharacterized protein n=1 Tax=Leptomonas pyrrhocoris TaxID=157538 RepID=A0A0N0DV91_LEPPY|nr:hypothetical protein ABB37_05045 [Leptomonas pyrrhocoris]XP_015658458.1 hypothetical protein ABB37_05045 [Leptomonas pyrrhocoris]XP_015658459.1 hypothetical protein ABB37_05045 [Leptomonas pyrrhocoris]KPA80018.1 hypothetical protein ABB37_05045 [Leptomonas pyrrhocoris]KPA80019.1 hypothetical protein ABB37_05045 [Leptomonas pyrrhocoris]KPA80020.1 hypothetical protein ABB37_05045 [Leptomonas pyrrhocoris]|eukprot:XP_015658457.1 hypothetical protein ABB37_05045 [Leptomonas pyrrhocoris]